jgi:hypothetical protein
MTSGLAWEPVHTWVLYDIKHHPVDLDIENHTIGPIKEYIWYCQYCRLLDTTRSRA